MSMTVSNVSSNEGLFMLDDSRLSGFDTDEQVVLNRLAGGVSKGEFLQRVDFGSAVSNDEDVVRLMSTLKEKVSSMSDDAWALVQVSLPFDVPFSDEDTDFSDIS